MYLFAAAQQTITGKLSTIFQKFKKPMLALTVNEIKVTLRNVFTDGLFTLEGEKE